MAKETYGSKLTEIMRTHGLSLTDLSATSGIPRSYISHIRTGYRKPGRETIEKLAKALGIPMSEMLPTSKAFERIGMVPQISFERAVEGSLDHEHITSTIWRTPEHKSTSTIALLVTEKVHMEPFFTKGDIIYVDQAIKPEDGDYVLVQLDVNAKEASLRRYTQDKGMTFFSQLQGQAPTAFTKEQKKLYKIIGTVVNRVTNLK